MHYLLAIGLLISASANHGPQFGHEVQWEEGAFSLLQKSVTVQMHSENITAEHLGSNGLGQKIRRQQEQHVANHIKGDIFESIKLVKLHNASSVGAEMAESRKGAALLDFGDFGDTKPITGLQPTPRCHGGLTICYKKPLPCWQSWNPGGFCWEPYLNELVKVVAILIMANILWHAVKAQGNTSQSPITAVSQSDRQTEWDFFRFVIEVLVVMKHLMNHGWISQPVIVPITTPLRMPMFMFITGVFGRSVKYDSMANMLCYTAVSVLLAGVWKGLLFGKTEYCWFLYAILVYRLTITPCLHIVRKFQDNFFIGLLFVAAVGCLGRLAHPVDASVEPCWLSWAYYLASFFALGLVATPSQWMCIFEKHAFMAMAAVVNLAYVATFYSCPELWSMFFSRGDNWSKHSIALSESIIIVHLFVVLSQFSWMAILCRVLQTFAPQAYKLTSGWGRRTLYVYVLHGIFKGILYDVPFVPLMNKIPPVFTVFVISVTLCAILGSEATKSIFRWVLEPYWARHAVEQSFAKSQNSK